jgi:hypothetical protein
MAHGYDCRHRYRLSDIVHITVDEGMNEGEWGKDKIGKSILEDVLKMIEVLQRDKKYGSYVMYLPDAFITAQGGDPDDYPMLEGHPGIRVVEVRA